MFFLANKSLYKQDVLIYAYVFCMLFLFLARNAFNIHFPVALFILISCLPAIFGNNTNIIAVGLSCIPFSTGFQYKYALFVCVLALIIKNRQRINLSRSAIFVFVMMLWELLHFVCGDFSVIEFLRCFAELLFFATVTCIDFDEIDEKKIFRVFSLSVLGICGIMLYIQMQKYGFDLVSVFARNNLKYRFGGMNSDALNFGLNFNSNSLGYICNFSVMGMVMLIARKQNNKMDYALLLLSILFGFSTLSRTFLVCLFSLFALYIFSSIRDLKNVFKKIGLVLCIVGVIYIILLLFIPEIMQGFSNRLNDSDLSNGRNELFYFYLNHIFSDPQYFLYGIGLQDFQQKISMIYGFLQLVCHNGIEEVWVAWGIFGVLIFFGMLVDMVHSSLKRDKSEIVLRVLPLFILILDSFAGQLIRSGVTMLSLAFVYVALNARRTERSLLH